MESGTKTKDIEPQLIDCPFCGNAAIFKQEPNAITILCSSCPAQMTVPAGSKLTAQTLWNSRACECFGQNSLDHPEDWGLPSKVQSIK